MNLLDQYIKFILIYDEHYIGAWFRLKVPYWKYSEGNGKAYLTACGWPYLITGKIRKEAKILLRIDELNIDPIGWCGWGSIRPIPVPGP